MSLESELQVLVNNKAAIKAAIEAKNPSVAPTEVMSNWPSSIASISSSDPNAARYAIVTPTQTTSTTDSADDTVSVTVSDRAMNGVPLASNVAYLNVTFPPVVTGYGRDFFIRITVTGDVPSISFYESDGVTPPSFDVANDEWTNFSQGVNIIMFTETSQT